MRINELKDLIRKEVKNKIDHLNEDVFNDFEKDLNVATDNINDIIKKYASTMYSGVSMTRDEFSKIVTVWWKDHKDKLNKMSRFGIKFE